MGHWLECPDNNLIQEFAREYWRESKTLRHPQARRTAIFAEKPVKVICVDDLPANLLSTHNI